MEKCSNDFLYSTSITLLNTIVIYLVFILFPWGSLLLYTWQAMIPVCNAPDASGSDMICQLLCSLPYQVMLCLAGSYLYLVHAAWTSIVSSRVSIQTFVELGQNEPIGGFHIITLSLWAWIFHLATCCIHILFHSRWHPTKRRARRSPSLLKLWRVNTRSISTSASMECEFSWVLAPKGIDLKVLFWHLRSECSLPVGWSPRRNEGYFHYCLKGNALLIVHVTHELHLHVLHLMLPCTCCSIFSSCFHAAKSWYSLVTTRLIMPRSMEYNGFFICRDEYREVTWHLHFNMHFDTWYATVELDTLKWSCSPTE